MKAIVWLRAVSRWIGVDKAVGYTVLARGWTIVAGPITLYFIARFLSPQEQGFYYTFGSILNLQVFFELGLASVVSFCVSHERAKLEWTAEGTLEGDATAKARLASLLKVASTWYGIISLLFALTVLPFGFHFFATQQSAGIHVDWQGPWVWVVLIQVAGLFTTPLFAVLEGCGLVAQVAYVRMWRAFFGSVLAWALLALHWKLYVAPIFNTIGLAWEIGWVVLYKRTFLLDLLNLPARKALHWWSEIWPFQWKMAISGGAVYFIVFLFTPLLFAYQGAAAAGRMGMSLNIMGTISAMASAWVATKSAPFGTLIARRDYATLDGMFFPALRQSTFLVTMGGLAFWLGTYFLHVIHHPIGQRLLDPLALGFLVPTFILAHIVHSQGIYLRAHKQEPFLGISVITALLSASSAVLLGARFGATGMMAGFCATYVISGLAGTWIFINKRRLWSQAATAPNPEPGVLLSSQIQASPTGSPLKED